MNPVAFPRRRFLQGALACGTILGLGPRVAFGSIGASAGGDTLVLVVLRGGLDGLSAVVPVGEAGSYHDPRGHVAVPENRALPLDDHFGFHPALAPLHELYQEGMVALVPAAGSPDPSRSHFDQQSVLDRGSVAHVGGAAGWLARHLSMRDATPLQAIAGSHQLPLVLHGAPAAIAVPSLAAVSERLQRTGDLADGGEVLRRLSGDGPIGAAAATSTAAASALMDVPPSSPERAYAPQWSPLQDIAQLLNNGASIDAAVIDVGGWDLHARMGDVDRGPMREQLDDLARALAAFHSATAGLARPVTTLVVSEFGRTVAVNGSGGTDHGRGGLIMALGPGINGGVYGSWPGLGTDDLDDGALEVTTDFRDVLAEIVQTRLGNTDVAGVLPGHTPSPLGLTRA